MSRYRRVSIRIWGDEKFRSLSAPRPNAQTLFMFLITGSHTSVIPGLCEAGEAGMAETLGWPLAAFRRCFAEIVSVGIAEADWRARVVWVPKAIQHNEPASPSVVKEWSRAIEEIPECALKAKAESTITAYLLARGPAWLAPWATGQPRGQAAPQPATQPAPHQEQEQEQEPAEMATVTPEIIEPIDALFERFWAAYPLHKAKKKALKAFRALKPAPTAALVDEMLDAIDHAKADASWNRDGGRFVPHPATWLNGERWRDERRSTPSFRTDISGLRRWVERGPTAPNGHDVAESPSPRELNAR